MPLAEWEFLCRRRAELLIKIYQIENPVAYQKDAVFQGVKIEN